MVQVPKSTGAAYSKSVVDLKASVVDVSVSGASDGVEQHPNVETVDAVSKDALTEPEVTLTEEDH